MLEGKFRMLSGEQDGRDIPEEACRQCSLEIVGNRHTVKLAEETIKGTHKLDTSQSPSTIDASDTEGPFAGETLAGIFKEEGDIFTVCFAASGEPRPTEFTTKDGKAIMFHKWQREGS